MSRNNKLASNTTEASWCATGQEYKVAKERIALLPHP